MLCLWHNFIEAGFIEHPIMSRYYCHITDFLKQHDCIYFVLGHLNLQFSAITLKRSIPLPADVLKYYWISDGVDPDQASFGSVGCTSNWRAGDRRFNAHRGRQHSFMAIDHEIFSTVILSLLLIQEGQLSFSGERMCTILVNPLEDKVCPVNVWLDKLTALDMTPLG